MVASLRALGSRPAMLLNAPKFTFARRYAWSLLGFGIELLAAGVALTELRGADGAGLEDMFLELTADTQREGVAA